MSYAVATTIIEITKDPIWAYIMTGAVGLAGIGGTLWQARRAEKAEARNLYRSITEENARVMRAERRQIYARCQASFTAMLSMAVFHRSEYSPGDDKIKNAATLNKARDAMLEAVGQVRLEAPEEIANRAENLANKLLNYVADTYKGSVLAEEDVNNIARERTKLYAAMRTDLAAIRPTPDDNKH